MTDRNNKLDLVSLVCPLVLGSWGIHASSLESTSVEVVMEKMAN